MTATTSRLENDLPAIWALLTVQALVSAASLVVEIAAGRILAPYVGMSLYSWTSIIAVVLAGFSLGHWLGGYLAEAPPRRALILTGWTLLAAALTTGGAIFLLRRLSPAVLEAVNEPVAAILILTVAAFFLPSLFAGIPAPVLSRIAILKQPERAGRALGGMFAAGAMGAILGTLSAGFLFISWIGSIGTMSAVAALYALLALYLLSTSGKFVGAVMAVLAGFPAAAAAIWAEPVCDEESDYFCIRSVDVSEAGDATVRLMVLDHLGHGISARDEPTVMFTQHAAMLERLGRAAIESVAKPSAFFIGGGSYSIPRAWQRLSPEPAMRVAEIDPQVTNVAIRDFWFEPGDVDIRHGDARRVLASDGAQFDVIVGDAFTDIAVPPQLITREFFELVRARLTPNGVFLMNVIDSADRLDALASIMFTLQTVFESVEVWTERRASGPTERLVFVLRASATQSPASSFVTGAPDRFDFGRLSERWQAQLLDERQALLLSDDYAPIDRLLRWSD